MLRNFFVKSLACLAVALTASVAMGEESQDWRFGGDAYLAGRTVSATGENIHDLFAAGQHVTLGSPITGAAHLAGQNIVIGAQVGGDLYAAGQDIDLDAPVAGAATLAGQALTIKGPISGNLRAMGQQVRLEAPVAGSVIIGADDAQIDTEISGDLVLGTKTVTWGDGATVTGKVQVYTDTPGKVSVPTSVAPADRVSIHEAKEFEQAKSRVAPERNYLIETRDWLGGVLVVGIVTTLLAVFAPGFMDRMRQRSLAHPLRAGLAGFIGLSALVGSILLLAMTVIGIVLIPFSLLGVLVLGFGGYIVGIWVIGAWAHDLVGRGHPVTNGECALAAFGGAVIGALICMIPWVGWLGMMAIFLFGAGAIVLRVTGIGAQGAAA